MTVRSPSETLSTRVSPFELFCSGFSTRVSFLSIVCSSSSPFNVESLPIDVFDELADNKSVCDEETYSVPFGLSTGDDDIEEDEFTPPSCGLPAVVKRTSTEFDLLLS